MRYRNNRMSKYSRVTSYNYYRQSDSSNDGYANISFFTNKFRPEEVLGKAVIIHQNPDDYRSQPSGDAGKRLACGIVEYISIDEWVD